MDQTFSCVDWRSVAAPVRLAGSARLPEGRPRGRAVLWASGRKRVVCVAPSCVAWDLSVSGFSRSSGTSCSEISVFEARGRPGGASSVGVLIEVPISRRGVACFG